MATFMHYTPGEYAQGHIRITGTELSDGRQFFYLDDTPEYVSGEKVRELKTPGILPTVSNPALTARGTPYRCRRLRCAGTR